jgi:hypothetical protein
MSRRSRVVSLGLAAGLPLRSRLLSLGLAAALPLALGASCQPRLAIVSPAERSQADPSGDVPISVDLGQALAAPGTVSARLVRGVDAPGAAIVPVPLTVAGTSATASLTAADLTAGRNSLFVSVDRDGDGRAESSASATFSWEPALDLANADRCDWLDPTKCLFPFPNDHFTVPDPTADTGRRVHLALESTPETFNGTHITPTAWNQNDGWSPGPKIMTRVAGLDLARTGAPLITKIARSLDADSPIVLIDAETGERQLVWSEQDPVDPSVLLVRVGKNLENGRRYVVALRSLADASGAGIPAGRGFAVYRDRIPTFLPAVEARRAHMEGIFASLAQAGIGRGDLFLAWDFTVLSTRSLSERMLAMRDDAFGSLGAAAPTFTVTRNDTFTSNDNGVPRSFRRVEGAVSVPLYLTNGGAPGSLFRVGANGLPERDPAQNFSATYRCTIPATVTAAAPGRLVLYGHGLLGSESEVGARNIRDITTAYGFVYCATKWAGMSEPDVPNVIGTVAQLSKFPTITDRLHQGFLNFLFLGRAMKHPQGFAANPAFQDANGASILDTSALFYDGNSQGAIAGGGLAAYAQDYTHAVLGVTGMNYSTLLRRSVDFDPFYQVLAAVYLDPSDVPLAIGLIQMLWDRVEASGVARHVTSDPFPGTPAKQILLHVAFGDHQVANVGAEVQARSYGARIHQPALAPGRHHDEQIPGDPTNRAYFAIDALPAGGWDGSAIVIWDSGTPTPPTAILPPRPELGYGEDPHETPRRDPKAQLQKSEFLRIGGEIVDVCGGAPCTAVDP